MYSKFTLCFLPVISIRMHIYIRAYIRIHTNGDKFSRNVETYLCDTITIQNRFSEHKYTSLFRT